MKGAQFDALTKALASRASRRDVVRTLLGASLANLVPHSRLNAQESPPIQPREGSEVIDEPPAAPADDTDVIADDPGASQDGDIRQVIIFVPGINTSYVSTGSGNQTHDVAVFLELKQVLRREHQYQLSDFVDFSYFPDAYIREGHINVRSYSCQDSAQHPATSGESLRLLIRNVHRRFPDRRIVLVGHSLGGAVITYALDGLGGDEDGADAIDAIVTLHSPLFGASTDDLHPLELALAQLERCDGTSLLLDSDAAIELASQMETHLPSRNTGLPSPAQGRLEHSLGRFHERGTRVGTFGNAYDCLYNQSYCNHWIIQLLGNDVAQPVNIDWTQVYESPSSLLDYSEMFYVNDYGPECDQPHTCIIASHEYLMKHPPQEVLDAIGPPVVGNAPVAVSHDSPESVAEAALQAIIRNDLATLGLLYGQDAIPPATWEEAWGSIGTRPDFTGCDAISYGVESWSTEGACQPTEHSTDVDAIAYFDSPGCGQLRPGSDSPAVHTVIVRTIRENGGWYLIDILGVNGNAPEFHEPCVDEPSSEGSALPSEYFGQWEGEGTQTDPDLTWPITVNLTGGDVGEVVGTVNYPPDTCSGELTFQGFDAPDAQGLLFREDITIGEGNCLDGGEFALTLIDVDRLQFYWSHPADTTVAHGVLTPASMIIPPGSEPPVDELAPALPGLTYVSAEGDIWLIDEDSVPGQIVEGLVNSPAWSHDGTRLAYVRWLVDGYPNQIEVVNADGMNQTVIVPPRENIRMGGDIGYQGYHNLRWASNDSALYYSYTIGLRGGNGIVRHDLSTGIEEDVVIPDVILGAGFDVAIDETLAALGSPANADASTYNLYLLDTSGQVETLRSMPRRGGYSSPTWSPDGARLAIWIDGDGLLLLDREGSEVSQLAAGPAYDIAWSPDGVTIAYASSSAFSSDVSSPIWTVPATGGSPIEHCPGSEPAWRPTDGRAPADIDPAPIDPTASQADADQQHLIELLVGSPFPDSALPDGFSGAHVEVADPAVVASPGAAAAVSVTFDEPEGNQWITYAIFNTDAFAADFIDMVLQDYQSTGPDGAAESNQVVTDTVTGYSSYLVSRVVGGNAEATALIQVDWLAIIGYSEGSGNDVLPTEQNAVGLAFSGLHHLLDLQLARTGM